ncbi:MAG: excinuclease ABC subunit UvrA, partial [Planctomycetota bacterium]
LYATLPESRVRGYAKGRFSFNVKGGRCEACEGAGVRLLEMQFLEAVEVPCETCDGRRFNRETLEILYKGRSIHDVLEMSIDEALSFFAHHPRIQRILAVCAEVGLGYIKLGQPSTTLSGGEAQRVKLASELARPGKGRTLYILDEPTTGLHFDDIKKLLGAIQGLVDQGNTVLVIEHNLDVIKSVDWIFDLGPEGGDAGGYLLAEGSPEDIAKRKGSHTGQVLRRVLRRASGRRPGSKNGREVGKRRRRKQNDRALRVFGARQHNLDGVAASFPARAMTVVTGPSGSGKTSLAFDTLFREGQRRFIESLSTYARRFLGRLDRAPVDKIEGLLPAIAIDQRSAARNPRSTVGTSTEILDYLRLLFARVGRPHCPEHGEALVRNSPSMLAERMSREWNGHKGHVLAPTGLPPGLEDADLVAHVDERIREWKEEGFVRYGVLDGDALVERRLEEEYAAAELRRGLYLIVDRLRFGARSRSRLAEAFELAARWGKGLVALAQENGRPETWSMERSCTRCGFHLPLDLHPRLFSFNHYSGACPDCQGLGSKMSLSVERLIKRPELPLFGGAMMRNLGPGLGWLLHPEKSVARTAYAMAESRGFDLRKTPYAKLSRKQKQLALGGSGDEVYEIEIKKNRGSSSRRYRVREAWPGLIALLEGHHARTESDRFQRYLSRIMVEEACPSCKGSRLSAASLAVSLGGQNIGGLSARTVEGLRGFLAALELHGEERRIAREVLAELDARLGFLADMGLEYLEIDRASSTLSGGEAQRIRLAGQLGSRLTGTLYVLDEPTVGLHPRDTDRLLSNLCGLRDLGNTVVCVEHDEAVIRRADWVVDLGPGAG